MPLGWSEYMTMSKFEEQCRSALSLIVAEIIKAQMETEEDAKEKIFRVNFLRDDEILSFLDTWEKLKFRFKLQSVRLVISSNPDGKFPNDFVADTPITYYRNHNDTGLIYLENEATPDAQSLKNAYTLRDTDVLNGVVKLKNYPRIEEFIIEKVWEVVTNKNNAVPNVVLESLIKVLRLVSNENRKIALRQFISFVVDVVLRRENSQKPLSLDDTYELIGKCLVNLEMFPDVFWISDHSDIKIQRRLFLNSEYAEFYQKGQPIDVDDLIKTIQTFNFRNIEGELYDIELQQQFRSACLHYCDTRSEIEQVPFFIFEQLFKTDTVGLKLGEKVEAEISEKALERLHEYRSLDVIDGLNAKLADDAVRFLEEEPDEAIDPLRDIITPATRKRIEKIARPSARSISNPFLAISNVCEEFYGRDGQISNLENVFIKFTPIEDEDNSLSTFRLFKFLYANSLTELVERRSGYLDEGVGFEIDESCKTYTPDDTLDKLKSYRDGEEDDDLPWAPVLLKFELFRENKEGGNELLANDLSYQWFPENLKSIATYWLHTIEQNANEQLSSLELPADYDFDKYAEIIFGGTVGVSILKQSKLENIGSASTLEAYSHLLQCIDDLSNKGLSIATLRTSVDYWKALSSDIRNEHVPTGEVLPIVDEFVGMSILHNASKNSAIMMPTHPIKQRWIAQYLEKSIEFAEMSLAGEINLNSENTSFYIDWIFNTSSQQQPAFIYGKNKRLLFSAKEHHWFETYTDIEQEYSISNNIDTNVTDLIVKEIKQYLQVYPHKTDGLSILVALTNSPQFPTKLIEALCTKELSQLNVKMHVLADENIWGNVRNHFEKLPVSDRLSSGGKIHPSRHLHLYDLSSETLNSREFMELKIDIAVRPQFFSERPQIEEETRKPNDGSGTFKPLLDKPTQTEVIASGNKVSIAQLPSASDLMLENWSTILVRHKRLRALAPDNLDNIDMVKLTSDFEKETRLLNILHMISHWVLTVEKNITRQYIEGLEVQPAILAIKENLGLNSSYTMITSSNTGHEFSIKRLTRKIHKTLNCSQELSTALAEKVFGETKSLAPSLALQAMGISRITEEMLGLIIAKKLLEHFSPANFDNGLSAWISLDTHTKWFGGPSSTRADLCRLDFQYDNQGDLSVSAIIAEAKFRQTTTNHGQVQIERTLQLFENFMPADTSNIDAELWRNTILDAVNNCATDSIKYFGEMLEHTQQNRGHITQKLRDDFRGGNYRLKSLSGFYSQAIYGENSDVTQAFRACGENRIHDVTTYANHIEDVLLDNFSVHVRDSGKSEITKINEVDKTTECIEIRKEPNANPDENRVVMNLNTSFDFRKLSNEILIERYQNILDTLGEHKLSVKPVNTEDEPYFEGPATTVFRLRLGSGFFHNAQSC